MKGLRIKYQLRLVTLIPVLAVSLLFAFFYNTELYKILQQHVTRLGEAYIRQLSPAAQLAITRNDRKTLQALINASTVNPDVVALAFYDERGQVMAYRGGRDRTRQFPKLALIRDDYIEMTYINPHTVNFIAPITIPTFNLYAIPTLGNAKSPFVPRPDTMLGWLSLDIDTQSLLIKRYQMFIITILITLLGLLTSLSIHCLLSRRILVPIARLRRSLNQIKRHELDTRIEVLTPGELGEVEAGCAYLQDQYKRAIADMNYQIEIATDDLHQGLELLEEKNVQLSLEKKKVEEKNRQKSEFIANISHEIRTPMNGVIGFTNVLFESKLDSLQLDYVKTIKSSAQDLMTIINDILDYSKMDSGQFTLDCIPVDVRMMVDEVMTLMSPAAQKKNISLIPFVEVSVPKIVLGDPVRLKQLMINLVNNAIKFTDQGHVLVRLSCDEETENAYQFTLLVEDTGMGISAADQSKLFHAFKQADLSITRRFGGTGLGLVICKKLAEMMQGKIHLTSTVNFGSTFTVQIKLEKPNIVESDKSPNEPLFEKHAIIFDEELLSLEATSHLLRHLGVSTTLVNQLHQLEEIIAVAPPQSLLFIDVKEGMEDKIAHLIKHYQLLTILTCRGFIQSPEVLGAATCLLKPLNTKKMTQLLAEISTTNTVSVPAINDSLQKLREEVHKRHLRVLVAEDSRVSRFLLEVLLKDIVTLHGVDDGLAVLEACAHHQYDLLLLDEQMPRCSGQEVVRLLRERNQLTPVILVTANVKNMGHLSGIHTCLQKPVDEEVLLQTILDVFPAKVVIDWPMCVQKAAGKPEVAREFMRGFIKEIQVMQPEIQQLFAQADIDQLGGILHKLSGACSFCGVPELYSRVRIFEKYIHDESPADTLNIELKQLLQAMDNVVQTAEQSFCDS